jgi:ribose transport system ATP-binding protein
MLEIHHLSKSYGAVNALIDVSFPAERGRVTALLGENGAGKSTLVKILSGLVAPTAGSIAIDGKTVDTTTPDRAKRSGVAVVQQEISVLPNLTVAENFMLSGRTGLLRRKRAAEECLAHLGRLGLGKLDPSRRTGDLTVGERQLVEIARMLAQDAQVLVLDEPTAALADRDIALVHAAVKRLAEDGKVVMYITHRLNELAEICDRAIVLRNGRLADAFDVTGSDLSRVVRAMIGRELREFFPDANKGMRAVARKEQPRLTVKGIRTENLASPVDFEMAPGEIVAMSGQIGSGFVEPLRALAGISPTLEGAVALFGKPYAPRNHGERAAAEVCYCSEDRQLDGFFPDRAVWENLSAPALAASGLWGGASVGQMRRSAEPVAQQVTLSPSYYLRAVRTLSGGNAQKVSIGKWLSGAPKLFLLEEPTRGVDVGARAEIYRILRGLADRGLSILFSSTDLEEVLGFAERVLVFHNRKLVHAAGTASLTRDELATWITHGSRDA